MGEGQQKVAPPVLQLFGDASFELEKEINSLLRKLEVKKGCGVKVFGGRRKSLSSLQLEKEIRRLKCSVNYNSVPFTLKGKGRGWGISGRGGFPALVGVGCWWEAKSGKTLSISIRLGPFRVKSDSCFAVVSSLCFWSLWCVRMQQQLPFSLSLSLSLSVVWVTVFKQHANRLAALNERLIGIKVGDFCHVREGLVLGQLLGNRFTITLRGVVADSEETIKASADALGRLGFINYFGLQRFGSGSVPTHLIGAALLRGEWETAAREYYKESDDIEGTLRQFPRHLVAERAILRRNKKLKHTLRSLGPVGQLDLMATGHPLHLELQCLKKYPGNCLQALKAIPRTLRMMKEDTIVQGKHLELYSPFGFRALSYLEGVINGFQVQVTGGAEYVHSYQSYLWNHAASMRVQKYGDNAEKVTRVVNSEFDDDGCSDAFDSSHFDEISETDLPEERNDPVKVVFPCSSFPSHPMVASTGWHCYSRMGVPKVSLPDA
ncbi:Pseudouridylate synthase 7-like [Vitis vinifera]|uniref:Pseudouridylate synthase 7-like n=1 Tax=Vitis vinifera TaxID=29760 RepID=A0A438IGT0_VITVI|nr:Pseudouridylate synthase 7-like [Vitis vinifera]